MSGINREKWINRQKELIDQEKNYEIEQKKPVLGKIDSMKLKVLETKGVLIKNLIIAENSTALFGRQTLKFARQVSHGKTVDLPPHTFTQGDIVAVCTSQGKSPHRHVSTGVVSKVASSYIVLALDYEVSENYELKEGCLYILQKIGNDVVYKRIKKGLDYILDPESAFHLLDVLFDAEKPYPPHEVLPPNLYRNGVFDLFNKNLNASQRQAVEFAVKQKDLAVIHGPPGTGKTTTLVEIILQHVKLGSKVLAVAPSNIAVDNMLERLALSGAKVVRLGHPARASAKAQLRTLDAWVECNDTYTIFQAIRKDIAGTLAKINRSRNPSQQNRLRKEVKAWRQELREREMRTAHHVLSESDVVLATLTTAGDYGPLKYLNKHFFDVTVIDECSQALESACYMAIVKSPKLVLAGDHKQLPPTVFSPNAKIDGLLTSLMERVVGLYGDTVTRMLKVQYRMNNSIMSWASSAMYNNDLIAHDSVANHLLKHIKGVKTNEDTECSLMLYDTSSCQVAEVVGDDISIGNPLEAEVVAAHVKQLIEAGVQQEDIGVITPYNLQVAFIKKLLSEYSRVEVKSVDGFQGKEKEAIVLSLVRSNSNGVIGFLAEERRLNVAVTRARRHIAVVANTVTVCRNSFIKGLIEHINTHGLVLDAGDYVSPCRSSLLMNWFDVKERNTNKTLNHLKKRAMILGKEWDADPNKIAEVYSTAKLNNEMSSLILEQSHKIPPEMKFEFYCKEIARFLDSQATYLTISVVLDTDMLMLEQLASDKDLLLTTSHGDQGIVVCFKKKKYSSQEMTNVSDEEKRDYFTDLISKFVVSTDISLNFGTNLNSFERRLIHEIAEMYHVIHESTGQDQKRKLVLRKPDKCPNLIEEYLSSEFILNAEPTYEDSSTQTGNRFNYIGEEELRGIGDPDLIALSEVINAQISEQDKEQLCKLSQMTKNKPEEKENVNNKVLKPNSVEPKIKNDMKLLDDTIKKMNSCSFNACREQVPSYCLFPCNSCKLNHCLKHMIPETHGCLKKQNRTMNEARPEPLSEEARAKLKKSYKKKVAKLENKRKVNQRK